jgi:hypothetical protein
LMVMREFINRLNNCRQNAFIDIMRDVNSINRSS